MGTFRDAAERLEARSMPVPWSGCTIYFGASVPKGYGVLSVNSRQRYAHRVAYEIAFGAIPEGRLVCHRCDVPACINVDHLFLGTYQENMDDMRAKGRENFVGAPCGDRNGVRQNPALVRGENNGRAKLTWAKVAEIRAAYANGSTQTELGLLYGVPQAHISKITRGKSWAKA